MGEAGTGPSERAKGAGEPAARATLADVAKRAGVSIATVSYVMNGRDGVGPETRERVLGVADDLGFRPNRLASGLRTGQIRVLGLVLADIANPFYPELAGGVIAAAADAAFKVFLSHNGADGSLDVAEVQTLCDHRCAALIFTSLLVSDGALLAEVVPPEMPVVQAIRRIPGLSADFVGSDDRAGAREAARHLVELGHRDVAVLAGPVASSASAERVAGYRDVLEEAGIGPERERVVECSLTVESGYRGAQRLLALRPPPPAAVLCGNDLIALGAIDAFVDHGLSVPGDVSVVGFDDIWFASSRLVRLTTVRQPRHELGRAAVALALERLADGVRPPREIVMPHQFVARGTTARPRRRVRAGAARR